MVQGAIVFCRQITDEFRADYAEFWHALVFRDLEAVKQSAQRMHAGDLYPLFVAMITKKPWKQVEGGGDPLQSKRNEKVRAGRR